MAAAKRVANAPQGCHNLREAGRSTNQVTRQPDNRPDNEKTARNPLLISTPESVEVEVKPDQYPISSNNRRLGKRA